MVDYRTIGSMETRDKILNSAQRLIQTRSFHGFSFQDIADEVGIRKASLYHYFDSKDAMALAVLKRATDWVNARMENVEGQEPSQRLEAYFDMFRVIHGKGERMCPGGSFGSVSVRSHLPCRPPCTASLKCTSIGSSALFATG